MRRLPNENGKKTYLAHGKADFFGEVELAHSGCRGPGSDRSPVLLQPVAGCMKNVGHYTSNRFDDRYGERYGLGSRSAKQPSPAVFRFCFRSPCVNRYLVNARALTGLCTQPKIAA